MRGQRPLGDRDLVQIVDAALASAVARSGDWLACKPGCTPCCHGVFAISMLDRARLRDGLAMLEQADPQRARRVRARAEATRAALRPDFPGDPATGILGTTPVHQEAFAHFANEEPCPVLDPESGTCDLYSARPMTCRVFGPPLSTEDGLGMCELCFVGTSETEMLQGELHLPDAMREELLNAEAETRAGLHGSTIVAFAFV